MWSYNYSSELYHFGVKGMRWGVRRYQNKNGSLTSAGKKHVKKSDDSDNENHKLTNKQKKAIVAGSVAVAASLAVIGGMYIYKKNNIPIHVTVNSFGKKINVDTLPTTDTVLKKGTKIQRISSKSIEDYSKEGRRIYASFDKKDNRLYTVTMPDFIKDWGRNGVISDNGKKAYKHTLIAKNDIKIASKKTMAEAYMKATNNTEVDAGYYQRFMQNLVNNQNPEVQKFFSILKKSGYNAIIDENDAQHYAKSPIILLDPKNDISNSKSHKIGKIEKVINTILM